MGKKFYATAAIAILALFAVPTAAIAAGYVPQGDVVVSGDAVPSGTVSVSFTDGSFTPGESVSFAVTGAGTATLSTIKAGTGTLQKSASSAGAVSVTITLPSVGLRV